jgi:hypothetical protein
MRIAPRQAEFILPNWEGTVVARGLAAGTAVMWRTPLRRECLDHVLIFGERHLRRILALDKDAPLRRAVQGSGTIIATPILFGLHHRYARI